MKDSDIAIAVGMATLVIGGTTLLSAVLTNRRETQAVESFLTERLVRRIVLIDSTEEA